MMLRTMMATALVGLALAPPVGAQGTDMKKWARDLGIAVGETYVCTEGAEKAETQILSEAIFDTINFEASHEIAYIYAVGVGYGAALERENRDCDALKAHVEKLKAHMNMGVQ